MAYSILSGTGNGVTDTFPINFTLGFISREHIKCRVGNEVDGLGDPVYRSLNWINDGLVQILGGAPGNGVAYEFTRTVPLDGLIHDYTNGEEIEEQNLDDSNKQTLMAVHQVLDGRFEEPFQQDLNLGGHKLTNVGNGVALTDAATVGQIGDAPSYAAAAAASAATATTQAGISTTQAGISTTQAGISTTGAADAIAARDAAIAAVGNVKVSSSDTTAGKLATKLTNTGSTNILSKQTVNPGANETLNLSVFEASIAEAEAQTAQTVVTARRLPLLMSAAQDAATDLNNFSLGVRLTAASGITNLPTNWSQGRYLVTTLQSSGTSYKHQTIVGIGAGTQEDARIAWRKWNGTTWTAWNTGVGAITTPSTPAIGTAYQWTGPDGWLIFNLSTSASVTTSTTMQLKVGTTATPTDVLDQGYFYGHANTNWPAGQGVVLRTLIRSGDYYKIDKVVTAGSDPDPSCSSAKFRPLNAL